MYGLPTPMQVPDSYLSVLPEYRARLEVRTQRRMRMIRSLQRMERWVPARSSETSIATRARARVRARLAAGLTARVSPHRLFGTAAHLGAGAPDIVFFARSMESDGVVVKPIRHADLVRRLVPLLEYEWSEFDRYYALFRAAFPNTRNELIEKKTRNLESGLQAALKDKRTYEVCCRSPVPIREVFRVVEPLISSDGSSFDVRVRGAVNE